MGRLALVVLAVVMLGAGAACATSDVVPVASGGGSDAHTGSATPTSGAATDKVSAPGLKWQRNDNSASPAYPTERLEVVSGNASAFVLHEGDLVRGIGGILAVPGKPVRFCAPRVVAAVGSTGGRAPRECLGVRVTGVNLTKLASRQVDHGVITGEAELTGSYRHGAIAVTSQQATTGPLPGIFDDHVPCPAPPSGWARSQPPSGAATRYKNQHPDSVTEIAYLHPGRQYSVMYVLTTGDPAPVRAALTPIYGPNLCVQHSRYSQAQIHYARQAAISTMSNHPSLYTSDLAGGVGLAADEQVSVDLSLPILDTRTARLIDSCAPGLLHVDLWLHPIR